MVNNNRYYKTPFAESGNKSEVPDVSTGGAVGYDTGFGPDYELPQGSVNRKRIERDMYNGVLNGITKNLKQWQEKLYPTWIEDDGDGVAFSYPVDMIVNHNGNDWVSLEASNQEEPGTGGKWILQINNPAQEVSFRNVAAMQVSTVAFAVGKALSTGGIEWEVTDNVTSFPLGGGRYAQRKTIGSVFDFGLPMGGGVDVIPFIQAALNAMPHGGEYIVPASDFDFLAESDLVIPARCTLNMNNQRFNYSGTGYAVTCGTSDSVLTPAANLINARILLTNKDGNGIRLRGTTDCDITGYVEGVFSDFATRTNIGLDRIDGVDVSTFNNRITLVCNHMHESYRIGTTGSVHATAQHFTNCYGLGDQDTDLTSIGYNFQDSPVGAYDGTTITGGNIELSNTGIYFGNNAREITVNTRIEINSTPTSRKLIYAASVGDGISVKAAGLDIATMQGANGGIDGFGGTGNRLEDRFGNVRTNGNADSFAGLTRPIRAIGELTILRKQDASTRYLMNSDATETGEELRQCGGGSASFGAYDRIHGAAHATRPGDYLCGTSSQVGDFRVTRGLSGSDLLRVHGNASSISPGADGTVQCGDIAHRFSEVFSVNATINTSDARLKTEVKPLSADELQASKEISRLIGGWQWLAKVELEGEDARIHFGPTVQAVMQVLTDNNIEPFSLSFICFDEWEDTYKWVAANAGKLYKEDVYEDINTLVHEKGQLIGAKDSIVRYKEDIYKVINTLTHSAGDPLAEEMIEVLDYSAGDRYSLRKTELVMFILAGMAARMDAAGI